MQVQVQICRCKEKRWWSRPGEDLATLQRNCPRQVISSFKEIPSIRFIRRGVLATPPLVEWGLLKNVTYTLNFFHHIRLLLFLLLLLFYLFIASANSSLRRPLNPLLTLLLILWLSSFPNKFELTLVFFLNNYTHTHTRVPWGIVHIWEDVENFFFLTKLKIKSRPAAYALNVDSIVSFQEHQRQTFIAYLYVSINPTKGTQF